MEWTQEATLNFIELYREKELLWDTKSPYYYNKIKKQDAWQKLAKELRIPVDECKKKSSSLLAYLRREKCKIKKSQSTGNGRDEVYISTWFAFKSMRFLWDRDCVRETKSTMAQEGSTGSDDVDLDENALSDAANEEELAATSHATFPELSAEAIRKHLQPQSSSYQRRKKRSVYDERLEQAYDILQKATNPTQASQSESQTFGNLVSRKLEKYTTDTQTAVQQEIMHVLFKADRGYYNRQHYISTQTGPQIPTPYIQSLIPLQSNPNSTNSGIYEPQSYPYMHTNTPSQLYQSINLASHLPPFYDSCSSSIVRTPLNSHNEGSETFQHSNTS